MTAFDALHGTREGLLDALLHHSFPGKENNYSTLLAKNNNIICRQEIDGKHEFLQAIQVLAPQFRLYGMFIPNNLNAGGSVI